MQYVDYKVQDAIAIITINRPSALNALNADVFAELNAVISEIDCMEIRCVIVTGVGDKAFVAGADIGAMLPLSQKQGVQWCLDGNAVLRKLETLEIPVIAAINGYALGGGCELAMACDIRLASSNAIFGQPEVGLGITAGFGGTQRLPRLVGQGIAKEILYTASKIDAVRAKEIGLVNEIYSLEELMPAAIKMAGKIARNAPIAVRATKRAVNEGVQTNIDTGIGIEARQFGLCFETKDQVNAMTAFLEKRKPDPFINQ